MDTMTYLTHKISGLPKNRIIGMGGALDSARFKYRLSEALSCPSSDVSGMVIGGHSYSHPFLNKIPVSEMQIEIDNSLKFLRKTVSNDINSFAYPYGAFDDNVVEHLKKIKIDYAFDTRKKGKNEKEHGLQEYYYEDGKL